VSAVIYENYTDLRRQVRARDGGDCYVCGLPVDPRIPPGTAQGETLEHVIPKFAGGSDEPANLRLSHGRCNRARDYEEIDATLIAAARMEKTGMNSAGVFARYAKDYILAGRPGKGEPAAQGSQRRLHFLLGRALDKKEKQ
jgi:hypothetical protein